jgi:hypothetical protein
MPAAPRRPVSTIAETLALTAVACSSTLSPPKVPKVGFPEPSVSPLIDLILLVLVPFVHKEVVHIDRELVHDPHL